MNMQIAQNCPQCGAPVDFTEADRLLLCPFCGTHVYLQAQEPCRYVLPPHAPLTREALWWVPYLRFRGTIYLVTRQGIDFKVIDTTALATDISGLQPSLGVRAQAMQLHRLAPETSHRYLPLTIKPQTILEKAVGVGNLAATRQQGLLHRAYIGEQLSVVYLPLAIQGGVLLDAASNRRLGALADMADFMVEGAPFNPAWAVRFLGLLCPHCGATMEGASDSRVILCNNCHRAWAPGAGGLEPVDWAVHEGGRDTALYLPFWRLTTNIPLLSLNNFADFLERTNQPVIIRDEWRQLPLSFWIPAFKIQAPQQNLWVPE